MGTPEVRPLGGLRVRGAEGPDQLALEAAGSRVDQLRAGRAELLRGRLSRQACGQPLPILVDPRSSPPLHVAQTRHGLPPVCATFV
jgi:hypothetical protein